MVQKNKRLIAFSTALALSPFCISIEYVKNRFCEIR